MNERSISSRALFAVVYTTSVSSVYFALGVIAHHAAGLTPVVLLVSGIFFGLSAMTYGEGASLHQERGGASVFAHYGLNDTVSFIAAWAIVLDYTILVAVTALTVPNYLAVFWAPLGRGGLEIAVALAVIGFVAADNLLGVTPRRLRRRILVTVADLSVQAVVIIVGLAVVFDPHRLTETIHLGSAPSVSGLAFALPIAVIAFTGLEAAASLAAETTASPRELRLLIGPGSFVIVLVYVGIAIVGIGALPVHHGLPELGSRHLHAPLIGLVEAYHPRWLADVLKYTVAVVAAAGLMAAAGSSMLGVSRVGFLLSRNRQIPSVVGRLHQRWGTPWVVIAATSVTAAALVLPTNLELLVGIYAFGALLAFTIAHLAVIALRFREPDRPRGYRIPFSVPFRGVKVPLPAVLGALLGAAGWLSLVAVHAGARYVGIGWLLAGLGVYYGYRRSQGTPVPSRRVSMPQRVVRHEALEPELGSIMVPIFGNELDDDIVQTAARLAGPEHDDLDPEGAVIEAIWVFEVPLALPLDVRLPDAQIKRAKEALARAKVVGEEYEGVVVQTAMVRARRAGQAIVAEAVRRGVEAIVLAAEEPSRVRGGALLGSAGPLDNYLGEVTKYVIKKAPVRVILTAPPDPRRAAAQDERGADAGAHESATKP
ncbi:MAG: basic amino acid/polyamine antiporter, family [Solirubrobacteraceae bacterium]|jgi:APA family basic amino acid/polyamine antiporter|nr:basic amino acid/polyamine antiporter, family [Solirubrobacteraceae bacterium]